MQQIGEPQRALRVQVSCGGSILDESWAELRRAWSATSHQMRKLRDDPECAAEEYAAAADESDPGLHWDLCYDALAPIEAPYVATGKRPRVAVLREQGVNSQVEMAAVLQRAGFESCDLHMSELLDGAASLEGYSGLIACGGFSYGDVLGAGGGWAHSILLHERAREQFGRFFARTDTFSLGVCNGCQMMAVLKELIPGAEHWPRFRRNRSEQYEARLSLVQIADSPSIFWRGMASSRLPVAVAHGEGRAEFATRTDQEACERLGLIGLRYIDNHGQVAVRYPANPSGTPAGIAALTTPDGRASVIMPHPERVFRTVQNSWHPADAGPDSGWMRMFRNARVWLG